jgi:hypothetical protein
VLRNVLLTLNLTSVVAFRLLAIGEACAVKHFVNRENIKLLEKQLANPKDDEQRRMLLPLLAEEEAKAEELAKEAEEQEKARTSR